MDRLVARDATIGTRTAETAHPGVHGAGRGQPVSSSVRDDSFDVLFISRPRPWLAVILIAYLLVASSFVVNTPPWQAPDEPAHYNYIAHIAEYGTLPVLETGDYDQALLDRLLSTRFAAAEEVARLRYEFHQPPLYYLLATPVYWVSGGSLLALRSFSVVIGFAVILLLYLCLELVFPTKALILVGATAFSALLPMHVAMLSAVNNDGLAELLIMASMLAMLSWMRARFCAEGGSAVGAGHAAQDRRDRRKLVILGLLLGLGMLTKMYAYVLAPILLLAIVIIVWLNPRVQADGAEPIRPSWSRFWAGVQLALWAGVPATAMGALWWIRNAVVYDGWDLLGLGRHARVVAEQPRTLEWIASNGWIAYGERAFTFTFRSFWGVFGWMGVMMDARVYTACLLFMGIVFLGLLWALVRFISGRPDADMNLLQLWVLGLFTLMIVAVLLAYLWYNMEFMQHQGRYFFWGLLPISAIIALGWREVMQPLQGLITAVLALTVMFGVTLVGYATGAPNRWTLLTIGLIAMALLLQPLLWLGTSSATLKRMPSWLQGWLARSDVIALNRWARTAVWALPFLLLFLLDLAVPHVYILPQLAP